MKLIEAQEQDSERLKEFYATQRANGPLVLQEFRPGSFFDPYRLYADDMVTYILVDDDKKVHAAATLTFREGLLNGKRQILGYATDLQVSQNRKAILSWSQHFLPILITEREKRNCKYVFSVVAQTHRQAYNAFIRPRSPKRKLPRYHLFRRFQIISLHGRLPFSPHPLDTIDTRRATSKDQEALVQYLEKKKRQLPLYYNITEEEFTEELYRWKHFEITDFILALDAQKNIIGCVAPWNSNKVRQYIVQSYSGQALTLFQGLRFFSISGATRRLPKVGQPLSFRYLTHFYSDNPDIFYSLLDKSWTTTPNSEFLVFPHFRDDLGTRAPRSFVKAKMNCGLYCILAPEDPIPDFLKLAQLGAPPEIELPLL